MFWLLLAVLPWISPVQTSAGTDVSLLHVTASPTCFDFFVVSGFSRTGTIRLKADTGEIEIAPGD